MDKLSMMRGVVKFFMLWTFLMVGGCASAPTSTKVAVWVVEESKEIGDCHYLRQALATNLAPNTSVFFITPSQVIVGRGGIEVPFSVSVDFMVYGEVVARFKEEVAPGAVTNHATGTLRVVDTRRGKVINTLYVDLTTIHLDSPRAAHEAFRKVSKDFAPRIVAAINSASR